MLCVEDVIEALEEESTFGWHTVKSPLTPWDYKFVCDISARTREGYALSTKQAEVALKILRKYEGFISSSAKLSMSELEGLLLTPHYRKPLFQSTHLPKEVRYIGNSRVAFRCKFNNSFRDRLRCLSPIPGGITDGDNGVWFVRKHRLWIVEVHKNNVDEVMSIIKDFKFGITDEVTEFFYHCKNSEGVPHSLTADDEGINLVIRNDPVGADFFRYIQEIEEFNDV